MQKMTCRVHSMHTTQHIPHSMKDANSHAPWVYLRLRMTMPHSMSQHNTASKIVHTAQPIPHYTHFVQGSMYKMPCSMQCMCTILYTPHGMQYARCKLGHTHYDLYNVSFLFSHALSKNFTCLGKHVRKAIPLSEHHPCRQNQCHSSRQTG